MKFSVCPAREWFLIVVVTFSAVHFVHLDVIFPEETPASSSSGREGRQRQGTSLRAGNNRGGPKIEFPNPETAVAACSDKDTFCEDVPHYPGKELERIVSNNATALEFLRHNSVSEESTFGRTPPLETDRTEKPVCESVTKVVFPKAAKTSDDKWKYVVNIDTTEYKQGVLIEQCSEENAPCNLCRASKSRCVQKYIRRKLLAFDENNLESSTDLFNFPGSCVCYVTDLF